MICKFCKNVWDYKGSKLWATCPNCQSKTKTSEGLGNGLEGEDQENDSR